jgi:phytol kinase
MFDERHQGGKMENEDIDTTTTELSSNKTMIMAQRLLTLLLLYVASSLYIVLGNIDACQPRGGAFAIRPRSTHALRNNEDRVSNERRGQTGVLNRSRSLTLRNMVDSPSDDTTINKLKLEFYNNDPKRLLLPMMTVLSLSLASLAALTHHLPGPPIDITGSPSFWTTLPFGVLINSSPYTPQLVLQDVTSTALCIVFATVFVKTITYNAKVGNIEPRDSRKIIHTLSAPLFILLWPMFSNAYGARVFASIVPLLNALRLYLAGTGGGSNTNNNRSTNTELELASAISRSGDVRESLGGPFIYVMVLLLLTLLFWKDSAIGIVSLATMACGDGLADLIGRRYGSNNKWSFNRSKSIAGSTAFIVGSFISSFGLLSWLTHMGAMDALGLESFELAGRLFVIAVICAGVELIPAGDDNYSVPLAAAVLSALLLNSNV